MELHDNTYIKTEGLLWEGVLKSVAKSPNKLQPIFEAITNSLEALALLKRQHSESTGKIIVEFHYTKTLFTDTEEGKVDFDKIIIKDNGIGFDNENFDRVFRYKDIRKGFNNRGSGRLQFLHYFDKTQISSIFHSDDEYWQRDFVLSKDKRFVTDNNATIYYIGTKKSDIQELKTSIFFSAPLDDKDQSYYEELNIQELKEIIINRYMMILCSQRDSLPEFRIDKYINSELKESAPITVDDIPELDKQITFGINYSKISKDLKRVEKDYAHSENFTISAYKIGFDKLKHNSIKLTSKNEVIENVKIRLENLKNDDFIDNKRYLFFISSPYIDELDGDVRGDIVFLSKTDFKKNAKEYGYANDQILLDDVEEQVNDKISSMYDEIKKKAEDKVEEIKKLTEMFLLREEAVQELRISINDSNDKILEKIYAADAKIVANQDAEIKNIIDTLDSLNPTNKDEYQENFEKLVTDLVYNIPLQDRTTLSRYVARRKLVLDLYDKILDNKLTVQNEGRRNNDEALLHNLIFRQKSDNPSDSDLWIINEDFIYFNGCSETRLCDIQIGDEKLFKDEFSDKEEEYLKSLGENRMEERPDILVFPDEGKCIIIELKNPNRNIGLHLNEITHYASLIRNFTADNFQIDTFYGYLIGEGINQQDVRTYDGDFKAAYQFDYMFRPAKTIPGEYGRKDGSLYTEILSYRTLHERASKRNDIFIKKIGL